MTIKLQVQSSKVKRDVSHRDQLQTAKAKSMKPGTKVRDQDRDQDRNFRSRDQDHVSPIPHPWRGAWVIEKVSPLTAHMS